MKNFNPETDLKLERIIDVPRHLVWRAWTEPELLKKWFAPNPWTVSRCSIDLKPGGKFETVMSSPEGEEYPAEGCFLEIIPGSKLVWTDALTPNFRPSLKPFFTGTLFLEDSGNGTKYTAIGMHKNAEDRNIHAGMGFEKGWSQCLDQLVVVVKNLT